MASRPAVRGSRHKTARGTALGSSRTNGRSAVQCESRTCNPDSVRTTNTGTNEETSPRQRLLPTDRHTCGWDEYNTPASGLVPFCRAHGRRKCYRLPDRLIQKMQEYNAARQRRQDLSMFAPNCLVCCCNFKVVLRGLRDLSTAETKGVRGLLWERGGARAVPWVVNCKVLFWLLLISQSSALVLLHNVQEGASPRVPRSSRAPASTPRPPP